MQAGLLSREITSPGCPHYPPIAQMIWDNRQFLARAVGWVARQGISQFIDLGPGLPTSPSTHEAARAVTPGTRVAYVDFDPLVGSHLDALVANGQDGIVVMAADVRDRDAVLSAPDLAGHIDLSQPTCLVTGTVLHFLDAVSAANWLLVPQQVTFAPFPGDPWWWPAERRLGAACRTSSSPPEPGARSLASR